MVATACSLYAPCRDGVVDVASDIADAIGSIFNSEEDSDNQQPDPNAEANDNDGGDSPPDPRDLSKIKGNKAANEAAQEAGFDGAHDAKEDRGGSQVNIYKDKEGNYWLWGGNNKSEPDPL